MKVCFVIQKLVGLRGGAERVLIETCNAMAARGMQVTILTYEGAAGEPAYPMLNLTHRNLFALARPQSGSAPKARRLERAIKAVPDIWPITQLKWKVTYARFITALERAFRQIEPDAVVGFMPTGIMAAAFAAAPLGIPVIASTHNVPQQDYGEAARWDSNPVYRKKRLQALHMVQRILVLQDEFKAWFDPELADRIETMPNAIAPAQIALDGPRSKTVLGVGRLTRIKRYDMLIRSFGALAQEHPDWNLVIYGDGPERGALQALVHGLGLEAQVRLAGTTDQIMAAYAKASILCHPAEFEGFGLSVGEALAHGLPVVADHACSGVNAMLRDGESGLLAEVGSTDLTGFAQPLARLMQDAPLRARMSAAAPASIAQFAPERVLDKWEALLRSCKTNPDLI